ncbi:hypothetical protein GCM10010151_39800 [Actinoallomurus spadix]|uniref:Uncharacterized protein n=1 Tax=Actinoallomurus spadix TaxID=79912 RepID=A0ABP3GLK1_9ACTN
MPCAASSTRGGKELSVRRECLAAPVFDLVDRRARRLAIESRETMDHFDRSCIAGTLRKSSESLSYAHLRPHEEPALWLPDALAWTYGAGGDWRRRVQPIIELTRNFGVVA